MLDPFEVWVPLLSGFPGLRLVFMDFVLNTSVTATQALHDQSPQDLDAPRFPSKTVTALDPRAQDPVQPEGFPPRTSRASSLQDGDRPRPRR